MHGDYRSLLGQCRLPAGHRIVAFLAPPWADALSAATAPSRRSATSSTTSPDHPILYVIEIHERLVPEPLAALRTRFEWSELKVYDIAGPTGRHGILLGSKRW